MYFNMCFMGSVVAWETFEWENVVWVAKSKQFTF